MKKLRYAAALVLSLALVFALAAPAGAVSFGAERLTSAVYTGDNMNIVLWIVIFAVSALLLIFGLVLLLRGRKKGGGGHER